MKENMEEMISRLEALERENAILRLAIERIAVEHNDAAAYIRQLRGRTYMDNIYPDDSPADINLDTLFDQ